MAFDTNSEISGEFGETIGPPSISKRVSISNERVIFFYFLFIRLLLLFFDNAQLTPLPLFHFVSFRWCKI